VGKTAIAEGLAHRIVDGDVPDNQGQNCIFIDMGALIGSKYKGEFEERLKSVVKEVTAEGDIVLFIDEIHTLVARWRGCYGCSKYFEASFGSWRTARYWCNHLR
jgi:ATP-dependent Clp protease ATP-binding subunit ClpB